MLSVVFIGRHNFFNVWLARWLAARTRLRGIVWADAHRKSFGWRWQWLKRQLKKNGVLGVADQVLFRLWWLRCNERAGWDRLAQEMELMDPGQPRAPWPPPEYATSTANTPATVAFIKTHDPDLIFVNCCGSLIRQRVLDIPRLGTYILHEGVTPEYRGVHGPFWAVANGDFDKVGYTLLQANNKFDAGDVFAQGATKLDPLRTSLGYIGHAALLEGLDEIARFLKNVEQGTAQPIDVSGRENHYWSYFPYSQMRRIFERRRAAGLGKTLGAAVHPQPG